VPRTFLQRSIIAGLVAAAGTAGALAGVGIRLGTPARPFNAIATYLLSGNTAGVLDFHPGITIIGLTVHTVVSIGLAVAALLLRDQGHLRSAVAAVLVAAVAFGASIAMARWGGQGLAALLVMGDLLVVHLVLAVALALGLWLAADRAPDDRFLHM
jgi:hypothetical protein